MKTENNILQQNSKIHKTLAAWIDSGCFPHAIIIEGAVGSGRAIIAKKIVQSIFCSESIKPCGNCSACMKIQKDIHPDVIYYESEGARNSFHVDKVREIRSESWVKANDSDYKAFIIKNADSMTISAQNALLKTIEEPPEKVYFILICENKNKMLTTIRSRATTLTAELLNEDIVLQLLKEELPDYEEEDYSSAVRLCGGNIGLAKDYLQNEEIREEYKSASKTWENIKTKKILEILTELAKFERNKNAFIKQINIIREFAIKEIGLAKNQHKKPTVLQLVAIVDIIDEMVVSANMNANVLLLTTFFADKTVEIMNK